MKINPSAPYWLSPQGQARLAEMAAADQPEPAIPPRAVDPIQAKLSAHSAALARRAEIQRSYRRDPGPQPGELSDSDFYALFEEQGIDAALRASLDGGSAMVDHRWDAPENDFAKEWLASLTEGGES
jgi:hypothetical protein